MQSLLLLLLLLGIPLSVLGQSAPPIQRWPGVGDDEFLMGAYEATRPSSDRIRDLWGFMGEFGITTLIRAGHDAPDRVDSLMWSAGANQRLITDNEAMVRMGWARNVEFYLFDSTQSPFNQWKFATLSGGAFRKNPDEVDPFYHGELQERVYSVADSTVVNQVIAEKVCFDWSSKQVYRWPRGVDDDDSLQHSEQFLSYERYGKSDTTLYLAAIGHLFPLGSSQPTDQLFKIEVFHEIPKSVEYFLPDNVTRRVAGVDTLQRDTVLYVTKADLTPAAGESYNKYQEVVFPLHLRYVENRARGPLHEASTSRRMDIKLTWLGGEAVALRAIALRDGGGQRLSGRDATSRTFRAGLFDDIRRFLYGPSLNPDSLRRSIIGIYSGEEHTRTEYAG